MCFKVSPLGFLFFFALSICLLKMPANIFRHLLVVWAALALGHAAGWRGNPCGKVVSNPSMWIIMKSPVLSRPIPCLFCLPVHHVVGLAQSLPKGMAVESWDRLMAPVFVLLIFLSQLVFASHLSLVHVFWLLQQLMVNNKGLHTCQWHEEVELISNTKYTQGH